MMISPQMRDVLIEHILAASVPYLRASKINGINPVEIQTRKRTIHALLLRKLIRPLNVGHGTENNHVLAPSRTVITEIGRAALAKVLADYAEALIRAGAHIEDLRFQFTSGVALPHPAREVAEAKDLHEPV